MNKMKPIFRKLVALCLMAALIAALGCSGMPGNSPRVYADSFQDKHINDMRAAWISTVWSADFPSAKNNAAAQKKEFSDKLDKLQAAGINTVVVQVRPKADAFYKSSINPWSDILTGTQGKDPGYDPMAYMIEESHKRGMSFHAWINPYRITTSGADVNALATNHPARLNPQLTITYKNALYYNPELPEVRQHICDTVAEIVDNYDVDGIHFDDYFYPSGYPLPEGETRDGTVANARRDYVNQMVSEVYRTIKSHDSSVMFGISPIGIWKNSKSDSTGSATTGGEGYYSVFGDAMAWIKAGTIDYLVPQLYWKIGHPQADYETLVKWWSDAVKNTNVKLYIGQGIYTDAVSAEIDQHLKVNEKYSNVQGDFYFSAKDIWENRQYCGDKITAYYKTKDGTGGTAPTTPVQTFRDVPSTEWYYKNVEAAVALGIINGMGDGTFAPQGSLTVAEALTLTMKTKALAEGTTFTPEAPTATGNWYDSAVTAALNAGIIKAGDFANYNSIITREQMAYLFANALLPSDNTVLNANPAVPDLAGSPYQTQILKLYSLGILTGTGADRAFAPKSGITRAEAAAIIHRVADPAQRIAF